MFDTKSPAPVNAVSGLLTPEQVATVLHTDQLNALRLIARGDLPAKRMQTDGPFFVRADAIDRYASGNVAGFAMPPLDSDGWFRSEYYQFLALSMDLTAAFKSQIKPELETRNGKPVTSYTLTLTPPVQQLLGKQVVREGTATSKIVAGTAISTFREDVDYRSAAEVAMVDRFRRIAANYLRREVKGPQLAGDLRRLYQSPEVYQQVVSHAKQEYAEASFNINRDFAPPNGSGMMVRVTYSIRYLHLYPDTDRLAFLSF